MATATFTKTGTKATVAAKLPKEVFAVEVPNHELVKSAYVAYLANGRGNLAVTLKRGEVRGGGRKPWKQKGTGRARFGSTRNPIWRGGGIAFGPTGNENYSHKIPTATKRVAVKQALTLCNDKISVLETFECKDGKVKPTLDLFTKMGVTGNILLVVSVKDELVNRATRNLQNVKVSQSKFLNVYDIMNADHIIISQKSIEIISEWLNGSTK